MSEILSGCPPEGYASDYDDPDLYCQCSACRNRRAVMPAPPDYGSDGRDQFGYDRNGRDQFGLTHRDRFGHDPDGSVDAGDLDLSELWSGFPADWDTLRRQERFLKYLRAIVRNPDVIDDVRFCGNCGDPAWDDDLSQTGTDDRICDSCWSDWADCGCCNERFPPGDLTETLSGTSICESCRDNYYSWCDECEGWYPDDSADEHEHDDEGSGCCESPQQVFRVRNDGSDPLPNDTRITVTLPAGTISAEGLDAICDYLRSQGHYDLSYDLDAVGAQWQTKTGNFAKRLSRRAYTQYQDKLTPEVLSKVGCIARDHSNPVDVEIEVTRDLNQSAAYFYHEDSCWWGSYYESRCALKTNGGFGLRSFDGSSTWPSGRAWVMPLRLDERGRLVPTFDTLTPDAFVVFNGYGDLDGYAAARIMAHLAGWTYRKIRFSCSPMYVNAGGYLIAPEHVAEPYTDGSLYLSVDQHSRLFYTER